MKGQQIQVVEERLQQKTILMLYTTQVIIFVL